jgi:hypothetical protein
MVKAAVVRNDGASDAAAHAASAAVQIAHALRIQLNIIGTSCVMREDFTVRNL